VLQGEQQRLAWARLLIARPRLALLDEATSALDSATERALYSALASSGITYVSIGHRDSLRSHHARLLTIQPGSTDGAQRPSWSVATMSPEMATTVL
jgi:putative ATP-binding cassette transporter